MTRAYAIARLRALKADARTPKLVGTPWEKLVAQRAELIEIASFLARRKPVKR